jgi:hypothetical protein
MSGDDRNGGREDETADCPADPLSADVGEATRQATDCQPGG